MANVSLPLSITYDTSGVTPISDVIKGLQAADAAINDAVLLLPSFLDGLKIESVQVNVRSLSQESPLRELFLVSLIVAFQGNLEEEIPPMLETIFNIDIPDKYDSIVTVVTMIVLFYGASFVKDMVTKGVQDGPVRRQLNEIIDVLANRTGKSPDEIRAILDAKYSKPATVKRLSKTVSDFFLPSQREGSASVQFDRERIEPEVIKDLPYPSQHNDKEEFERFYPYYNVTLEIHAQDKDRSQTGWAAVLVGIHDKRIRMKLIEPVTVRDIWGKDTVKADVTIVSSLTADGYAPTEIHVTRVDD